MKPRSNGPYQIITKIGTVAYELNLPEGSHIRNVFHVSCLKKALGKQVTVSEELPPLDSEGKLETIPEKILAVHEKHLRNRSIREYLIQWKNLPLDDATWEGKQILQHPNLQLLVGKQHGEG